MHLNPSQGVNGPMGAGLASAAVSLNVPCKVCRHCPADRRARTGLGRPDHAGAITREADGSTEAAGRVARAGVTRPPAYIGRWLRPRRPPSAAIQSSTAISA
jgi:hypothetical protein